MAAIPRFAQFSEYGYPPDGRTRNGARADNYDYVGNRVTLSQQKAAALGVGTAEQFNVWPAEDSAKTTHVKLFAVVGGRKLRHPFDGNRGGKSDNWPIKRRGELLDELVLLGEGSATTSSAAHAPTAEASTEAHADGAAGSDGESGDGEELAAPPSSTSPPPTTTPCPTPRAEVPPTSRKKRQLRLKKRDEALARAAEERVRKAAARAKAQEEEALAKAQEEAEAAALAKEQAKAVAEEELPTYPRRIAALEARAERAEARAEGAEAQVRESRAETARAEAARAEMAARLEALEAALAALASQSRGPAERTSAEAPPPAFVSRSVTPPAEAASQPPPEMRSVGPPSKPPDSDAPSARQLRYSPATPPLECSTALECEVAFEG